MSKVISKLFKKVFCFMGLHPYETKDVIAKDGDLIFIDQCPTCKKVKII
jgi:hypothetical protein